MALIAPITASASGDNTIVAAVTGKKIRVKGYAITNGAATANSVKWRSGTTDISGLYFSAAALGPIIVHDLAPSGDFYFETVAGQALNLNLSAATAVGGAVQYTLE